LDLPWNSNSDGPDFIVKVLLYE